MKKKIDNKKKTKKVLQSGSFKFVDALSTLKFKCYGYDERNKLQDITLNAYYDAVEHLTKKQPNVKGNASEGNYCPKTKTGYCWANADRLKKEKAYV